MYAIVSMRTRNEFLRHIEWPFGQSGNKSNEFGRTSAASAIQVEEFDLFRIVMKAIQYAYNWTGSAHPGHLKPGLE